MACDTTKDKLTIEWEVVDQSFHDIDDVAPNNAHFSREFLRTNTLPEHISTLTFSLLTKVDKLSILNVSSNTVQLFSHRFYRPTLKGVCMDDTSRLPAFFVQHQDEGLGLWYLDSLTFNTELDFELIRLSTNEEATSITPFTNCTDTPPSARNGKNTYENNQLCSCNFGLQSIGEIQKQQWEAILKTNELPPFSLNFANKQPQALSLIEVEDQSAISTLINHALSNNRDKTHSITYQDPNESKHSTRFVNVIFDNQMYENIGYGFIQQNSKWYLWYVAGDSSKGFYPIENIDEQNNPLISMHLCIEDCQWWGQTAWVELNLATLMVNLKSRD